MAPLLLTSHRSSTMSPVLKNGAAVCLVFLALSPFTAPFSTCDVATLLVPSARREPSSLTSAIVAAGTRTDAAVLQSVWVGCACERVRLVAAFGNAPPPCRPASSPVVSSHSGGFAGSVASSPFLLTILRI